MAATAMGSETAAVLRATQQQQQQLVMQQAMVRNFVTRVAHKTRRLRNEYAADEKNLRTTLLAQQFWRELAARLTASAAGAGTPLSAASLAPTATSFASSFPSAGSGGAAKTGWAGKPVLAATIASPSANLLHPVRVCTADEATATPPSPTSQRKRPGDAGNGDQDGKRACLMTNLP